MSDSALRARLAEELHSLRGKSRGARGTRKGSALFTFYTAMGTFAPSNDYPVLRSNPVLGIRIWNRIPIRRIRMCLGLLDPDPDPIVRGMDPDPDPDHYLSHKCFERTEIMPAK